MALPVGPAYCRAILNLFGYDRSYSMNRLEYLAGLAGCICLVASSAVPAADSPNLNLARQLNEAFVEVSEKVSPSVVVIGVTQKPGSTSLEESDEEDYPFDFLPPE